MCEEIEPKDKKTNASGAENCCSELREDDGRVTFEDPEKHKHDWGRHLPVRENEDKKKMHIGDYHRENRAIAI